MNKKIILLITTFVVILSFLDFANAERLKLVVPEASVPVYTGQTNEIKISITNEGNKKDTFYFSVWPTEWVSMEKYWTSLDAGESIELLLRVTPPRDLEEGTRAFLITMTSLNTGVSDSKQLYLNIKRKTDVFLSGIKMNKRVVKPGEVLIIQPILKNLEKAHSEKVYSTTKILKDDLIIKEFEETVTIQPESVETLTHLFNVGIKHTYGDYRVEVELRDSRGKFLDSKETNFRIQRIYDMRKIKTTEYGIFYTLVKVEVVNRGNIPHSNYTLTQSIPRVLHYFFYPDTEPEKEEKKDNRIVYTWMIEDLNPGESKIIIYNLRFINVFIVLAVLVILTFVIIWFMRRPVLKKSHRGILVGEKEVTILIRVKNRGRKTLNNIILKDFVPALARVIKKFDTLVPEIKRKSTGTELSWTIDKVKPGDEVILTYRIKPIVEIVGELELPKAWFTYETKKGKRRRVASKTVIIRGKVK